MPNLTAPTFELGQTVRATRGPTTIVGEVVGYSHHTQPFMSIHPFEVPSQFSTFDIWANDGWAIEIITEPS